MTQKIYIVEGRQFRTEHQSIEAALVDEDHRYNLHISVTLTITVFSNSSDTAFYGVARPNMLSYSQIGSLIPEHITQSSVWASALASRWSAARSSRMNILFSRHALPCG